MVQAESYNLQVSAIQNQAIYLQYEIITLQHDKKQYVFRKLEYCGMHHKNVQSAYQRQHSLVCFIKTPEQKRY